MYRRSYLLWPPVINRDDVLPTTISPVVKHRPDLPIPIYIAPIHWPTRFRFIRQSVAHCRMSNINPFSTALPCVGTKHYNYK